MLADASLCRKCRGMCCTYVATEIDAPETSDDFDMLRWYVSHEGCAVYLENGKWYFETAARCKHLTKENLCAIYPSRPRICRDHGTDECEMAIEEYAWDVRLETLEDVEAYARMALRHKRTHGNGHFELSWERRARPHKSSSDSLCAKPSRRPGLAAQTPRGSHRRSNTTSLRATSPATPSARSASRPG